jgi:hypothetical protein
MDDLWLYDINGHRWICCYPGADTKNLNLVINADGFEATKEGQPLPVASMVHGYEMTTYDTDRQRFMSMPNPGGHDKRALPQRQREAVAQHSPGSRSAPWDSFGLHVRPTLKGLDKTGLTLSNPLQGSQRSISVAASRCALRDPGLCCATASWFVQRKSESYLSKYISPPANLVAASRSG